MHLIAPLPTCLPQDPLALRVYIYASDFSHSKGMQQPSIHITVTRIIHCAIVSFYPLLKITKEDSSNFAQIKPVNDSRPYLRGY